MKQQEVMARLGMQMPTAVSNEEQHENYLMQQMKKELEMTPKGIINPPNARFYYLRDKNGHPYITVAINKFANGIVSRGIAICSRNDAIDKAEGRLRAYARLQIAQQQVSNSRPIQNYFYPAVADTMDNQDFDYKAEYDVEPTEYERKILEA